MITAQMLNGLRGRMAALLSPYRMAHTLGVEEMAARLAALYCPEKELVLRAAALLHDLTKELKNGEQLAIFQAHGVTLRPDEQASPKVWHGMTAALEIPARFPDFADPELIKAVRWHSTGHANMTLPEAILLLADYIEEGRSFPDCIALRNRFFKVEPAAMTLPERRRHLRDILLLSFDYTLSELQASGSSVCLDTLAAREDLKNRSEF
jgi:nicotinate-nucleotide adenylyltransferase